MVRAFVAIAALLSSACAIVGATESGDDLSYLFTNSGRNSRSMHRHKNIIHSRQSSGTTPAGNPIPAAGGTSLNGKRYPAIDAAPPRKSLPKSWIARYNQKKQAGLIPDIPKSKEDPVSGSIKYPASAAPSEVCSWTLTGCQTGDIWGAPAGTTMITFDDGPTKYSADLTNFLVQHKQTHTRFVIGSSILNEPQGMKAIADAAEYAHLGVHTFSHTLQSTKTDLEIVGDIGWTMQLIFEWTGKVPLYSRCPEGDVDNRVRAIMQEVWGLTHVGWSNDHDDWCLKDGGGAETSIDKCRSTTYADVVSTYKTWALNSTVPGTDTLMHETKDQTVKAFKEYYGFLQQSKYKMGSVASVLNAPWYQNQYAPGDQTETVKGVLPSRSALKFSDNGVHTIGSAGGAPLGDYATLKTSSKSVTNGGAPAGVNAGSSASSASGTSGSSYGATSTSGSEKGSLFSLFAVGTAAALAALFSAV